MLHHITVLPQNRNMAVPTGECLLDALRSAAVLPDAPCGGNGTCGKCKVIVDGAEVLACHTFVSRDMTVILPSAQNLPILTEGISPMPLSRDGVTLAIDIGTTTVVAYLIENGEVLAAEGRKNPQSAYGADVVSRIRHAINGQQEILTAAIVDCVEDMANMLLAKTGKGKPNRVCIVGNPAMQQLFLGMPVDNLTAPPFPPRLTDTAIMDGEKIIPGWKGIAVWVVPNISGYIGGDTVACILSTGMHQTEKMTLLVDIGTNGEMVLGNRERMVACATAAGPALEGAGITFGMQASPGAIDHVAEDFTCHVIGEGNACGICGSGLLDAVSTALHKGLLNPRGRILNDTHTLPLSDHVFLTQEDIRQLQQAKGAIAAGIRLMAQHLGIAIRDIETVHLAGAFGTFLDPHSACRIGLIPSELEDKIQSVGNAAGSGATAMVCDRNLFAQADAIVSAVEPLNLAMLPDFAKYFARSMHFDTEEDYWCKRALSLGFSHAAPINPEMLTARADVRNMCAADKCGAYGKNHTCPPYCGTLEECEANMRRFSSGILVQTVGTTEKAIDTKAYRRTETKHLEAFWKLCGEIRAARPNALCLGSGGCRICKKCAWPDPCRFPEKAYPAMEAYGLFVTEVCRDHGLSYHHGERTITYTACVLF